LYLNTNSKEEFSQDKLEILKNIGKDFYNSELTNKTENLNFSDFLGNKKELLNSDENKKILNFRDKKIKKILPSYIKNLDLKNDKDLLTDFKFINYIESMVETFSLKHNDSI
jgi:hypothetical protein